MIKPLIPRPGDQNPYVASPVSCRSEVPCRPCHDRFSSTRLGITGADSTFRACVAVSAPDCGGHVRPVLIEPRHGFWPVHAALEGRECRVFERLLPEPVGGVVD